MAHRYKVIQDFEHMQSMTFLKRGEIIEYMRDLHAYVKIKPYGMIQIPAGIVHKHPESFELLPSHEEDEYSVPTMLDEYTYVDSRLEPVKRKYSETRGEVKLVQKGNYFMGRSQVKDATMAALLVQMILTAIKHSFARTIKPGVNYYRCPLATQDVTVELATNENSFSDFVYRMMGNCFEHSADGEAQAREWAHTYQPALYYFWHSKY